MFHTYRLLEAFLLTTLILLTLSGCDRWQVLSWRNELEAGHAAKDPVEAERHYEKALKAAEKIGGEGGEELVISTLWHVANVKRKLEKLGEAESVLRRSIDLQRKLYGSDYTHLSNDLSDLAKVLEMQGRLTEAREWFLECLRVEQKTRSPKHQSLASTQNNLGRVSLALGDSVEADRYFVAALKVHRLSRLPGYYYARDLHKYAGFVRQNRPEAAAAIEHEADSVEAVLARIKEKANADTTKPK